MTTTTDATAMTAPDATEQFAGRFLGDLAAVLHAGTVVLGDKLGLYRGPRRARADHAGGPRRAHRL